MLGAILDLEKLEVGEVMTHRRNIVSINADAPVEEIVRQVLEGPYTRYPVWRGDPDTITGVLHAKDVLAAVQRAGCQADQRRAAPARDAALVRPRHDLAPPPAPGVPAAARAPRLRRRRVRRAAWAWSRSRTSWRRSSATSSTRRTSRSAASSRRPTAASLVEGRVTIRDLNRQFDWNLPDDEATTVAGLLIYEARRIPEVGESFLFHGFRFEVLRRQRHQLTLLRIRPEHPHAQAAA